MTTSSQPATADIAVVDAPAIPGLTFRRGRDGDWPVITDMVNRVREADGVPEVLSTEGLATEYRTLDGFQVDRDVLVAELDGTAVGMSLGMRNLRGDVLVLALWGAAGGFIAVRRWQWSPRR